MGRLRYYFALWAAKLSVVALKITRHNGTNFPGVVALRLCPDFLEYIKKPDRIIGVTGTNGKTTATNMTRDILQQMGEKVLCNSTGSNIATGIATAFISGVGFTGKCHYKTAVLEIDERSAKVVFPCFTPDYLVVLNLSRDSIMRNGHPEYIRDFLTRYIPEDTKVVLNADDLIASSVSPANERFFYGISPMEGDRTETDNLISDLQICPECSAKLKYKYIRYSNIGRAFCPECGFTAPQYDGGASSVNEEDMKFTYTLYEGRHQQKAGAELGEGAGNPVESLEFNIMNSSTFNIYNQVAVISLFHVMGYSLDEIRKAMDGVNITKSRLGFQKIGDKTVINFLCKEKNAYAASRVFERIHQMDGTKEILMFNNCIGDTHHWSENICWMYDADFEFLNDPSVKQIIVYGDRGRDLRLRMLLAGISEDVITYVEKPEDGVSKLKLPEGDNIYVLYGTDSFDLGMKTREQVIDYVSKMDREEAGRK